MFGQLLHCLFAIAIRLLLNSLLLAQRDEHLGRERYDCRPTWNGQRNGFNPRTIRTSIGQIILDVSQVRNAQTLHIIQRFERGSRIDRALNLAIAEMYLQGVSTRKVVKVMNEICGGNGDSAQAPQYYKQPLGDAGMEKYFLMARCFLDEGLRADRQPEFTQIDIEASFITPDDIYACIEDMLTRVWKASVGRDIVTPFPCMTWKDAVNQYGSDKPERRFEMKITDCTDFLDNCAFCVFSGSIANGSVVKAINARGLNPSVGPIESLTQTAIEAGGKGLAYIRSATSTM